MKLKKLLASILAVAFAAEPDYVAKLAGTDICFENLADAFTTEHNPENKQVMLLKDYTGDLVINNNRVNVFYLENYTFTGQIKVELGGLTLYGQTTISQGRGRIENTGIDGNYPLCFEGENSNHINISNCDIVATEENGVALYSDSMSVKINLMEKTTGENVNITGDVVVEDGFLNIAAGNTVNGDLDVTNGTLNISGGTFTSDVTDYIATGKMVADNGDGTYSVVVDPDAATLADLDIEDGEYLINDAYDFILFRNLIEAGQTGSNVFKITGEIDLDGYTLTGGSDQRFNGTLDGQGNTIKNVTINAAGKSNVGLINNLGAPGVVKNVTLQNVTVDGSTFVGALVGRSRSTSAVDNCHVTGTVDVDGSQHVGALMGNAVNSVTNCSVDATGEVSGSASVGGLVGTLTSVKGEIKGNSVSGISVNGNSAVGGISGNMQPDGVVIENNSVNSVEINGNASAGLVLGWILDNGNEMTLSDNSATDSTLLINGEEKSAIYGEIENASTVTEKIVAIANGKTYTTLKEAINDNVSGGTIYLMGELNEGSIKLPAKLSNITIDGQGTAVVKNTIISRADGSTVDYQDITIQNTTFENSRFVIGGSLSNDVIYKNITFDNNKFLNIVDNNSYGAVHMQLAGEDNEYVENFTFTNNVIDGVAGSGNGVMIKQAKGTLVFDNNVFKNIANNAIQLMYAKPEVKDIIVSNNEFSEIGGGVINLYGTNVITVEDNNTFNLREGQNAVSYFKTVVKKGNTSYATIQAAVDAAVAGDNEIVILPGTYDESFMVNQQEGVNVTITAANKGDVTLTGTISVNGNRRQDGETLTISNLVFDGSDKTAAHNFIIDSNGTANYPTYAHNVTVTNCDFVGNGDFDNAVVAFREPKAGSNNIVFDNVTATGLHSLIQVSNSKKITVTNSTITNGESVVNATGSAEVVFTNNIVNVENFAVRTGQSSASTNTVANVTMNNNTIAAGETALAMRNATTTAVMENNSIVAPAAFTAENADASTINGVAITADEIDAAVNDNNEVIPENMSIGFVKVEPGLYNIVITASDDIYEFVGAELTFANTSTTVANEPMNYEILGIDGTTNAEKSIEKADTYALRLVDGAERMSGNDLVIGQVKFYGQGDINFTVSEGKVVTTEYGTNLGQYYTLDADDATTDTLTVDAITNGAVEEVTRTVVVNVAYNHALDGNYWTDNQITVTLKDGFGNVYDAEDLTNGVATINNVKLGRLTVTLEAPGFRRYVYNTTLTEGDSALVLNFWNDIKRDTVQSPLAEIEAGVSGKTNKNFVVGDIVMDYTVDEYDLAAVTSYYGMYELTDADKYIKYDLNRDGNIDIIDVHYVLHTLNN